jgi:hypothetical protein
MTTQLRPHKVLTNKDDHHVHALTWTDGKFGGIVFAYNHVSFKEDLENDKLHMSYGYDILEKADNADIDLEEFEKELGDFLVQLLYYGLERDYLTLGFVDDVNPPNNTIESNSQ